MSTVLTRLNSLSTALTRLNSLAAAGIYLRLAVATSFLSAVADRFGMYGAFGSSSRVSWGDLQHFNAYTAQVVAYLPKVLVPAAAWGDTVAETLLGILLIVGYRVRLVSWLSGTLLLVLALSMTVSMGIQSAFAHSVFSASAGAFLLAAVAPTTSLKNGGSDGAVASWR
jgi:uncharacterized membrane protein YphA (DoxX/SURF4 family)